VDQLSTKNITKKKKKEMVDVERDTGVEGEGGGFENLKFKMSRG